jgi:hypothetical protein
MKHTKRQSSKPRNIRTVTSRSRAGRRIVFVTLLALTLVACAGKSDRWSDLVLPNAAFGGGGQGGSEETPQPELATAAEGGAEGIWGAATGGLRGGPDSGLAGADAREALDNGAGQQPVELGTGGLRASVAATSSGAGGIGAPVTRDAGVGHVGSPESSLAGAGGSAYSPSGGVRAGGATGQGGHAGAADAGGSTEEPGGWTGAAGGSMGDTGGSTGGTGGSTGGTGGSTGGTGGSTGSDDGGAGISGSAGSGGAAESGGAGGLAGGGEADGPDGGTGASPGSRATPLKAVLRYRDENGATVAEVTTTRFRFLGGCRDEDTVCFDALGLTLARQNEMELWLDLGEERPADETCWYYDYDTEGNDWCPVNDPVGCHWYLTDWGTQGTWMKETEDLDPYWTVHYLDLVDERHPFMAWGYVDHGVPKWIMVWSARDES